MIELLESVGYAMAVIIGVCLITLLVVLASPLLMAVVAVVGVIWILYAGLLLIGNLL